MQNKQEFHPDFADYSAPNLECESSDSSIDAVEVPKSCFALKIAPT